MCNDFLAGDVLRSFNRFKALDETALFGCGCRHEFPLMFVNLKLGERSFFQFVFILLLLIYNFVFVLAE